MTLALVSRRAGNAMTGRPLLRTKLTGFLNPCTTEATSRTNTGPPSS